MEKVTSSHLQRNAFLYIRQSSLRQVFENTESTERQYALRQRAVALGWSQSQITVIDSDLGQSGASAADREGFQRLVTEVSLGRAGIVMGLEVSRLARNSSDWHRLLELCALSQTLILDEDGVYDPAHFNDRLLLGLKGTMSEAELHVLRARLLGGQLNKARRGDLRIPIPVGFVYGPDDQVLLNPDQQLQESMRYFFDTFRRTGSAMATVKTLKAEGVLFPKEIRKGPRKGEIVWRELPHCRALCMLHNPRYAGAYCYGRKYGRKLPDGRFLTKSKPAKDWITLIKEAHEGYISWEEFQANQKQLKENANGYGPERQKTPPREGPALLQGLIICGKCGRRMTVRYQKSKGQLLPHYICQRKRIDYGEPVCQYTAGSTLDKAIGQLLLETVTPLTLEVALAVRQELQEQMDQAERLRHQQVERAQYEAELARRRYMQVDPDNRLVADELEWQWNNKLQALKMAQEDYESWKKANQTVFNEEQKAKILALATDFPRLWNDPQVPQRERKRMARLMMEDVTLLKGERLTLHVRFKGGTTQTLQLPRPLANWQNLLTDPSIIQEIDQRLEDFIPKEIAQHLNKKGVQSGQGKAFHRKIIQRLQRDYKLKSRYERLRERGLLTKEEIAQKLGIHLQTVNIWRRHGFLKGHAYNDKAEYLYEDPGENAPVKLQWKGLSGKRSKKLISNDSKEVQYET